METSAKILSEPKNLLTQVTEHRFNSALELIEEQFSIKRQFVAEHHRASLQQAIAIGFQSWSTSELTTYRELQLSPTPEAQETFLNSDLAKKKSQIDSTLLPIINEIFQDIQRYFTF
jgi:hypothetical protein